MFHAFIATSTAFILLLAIPPLISSARPVTVPPSFRRVTTRPLGKYLLLFLLFLLSLLPAAVEPILEDTTVFLVLLSTYFLPALLHIVFHNVRRPLSILIPSRPQPLLRSASSSGSGSGEDEDEELEVHEERWPGRRLMFRHRRDDWNVPGNRLSV